MPMSSAPTYMIALTALAGGGAVILPSPSTDFVSLANALGVTMTSAPPAMLAQLLTSERGGARLETMECFDVVGAYLPSQLAQEARSVLTPNLFVSYGTSETQSVATAEAAVCLSDPGTVGYVIPWIELDIIDGSGRKLPAGQEGEIRVRCTQMVDGYYRDPAATARNFRDGWFYPGDIGLITGRRLLRITGRGEDVIRRGGAMVSPMPIEEALRGLPGVRDVAVFPLERPDGAQQIGAALVIDTDADIATIRAAAAARLGDQAPDQLFRVESLPRNANGKVVRRVLIDSARRAAGRPPS